MSGTVILIILATIALMIGPLLWLRPTARDRQLERLRARARSLGVNVTMREIPDPDPHFSDRVTSGGRVRSPTLSVALYQRPFQPPAGSEPRHAPVWEVVCMRQPGRLEAVDEMVPGLRPGWELTRPGLPLVEPVITRLSGLLAEAPEGTAKVDGGTSACGLYWRERGGVEEVERIAALLDRLCALQTDLCRDAAREEARREAETPDD